MALSNFMLWHKMP